MHVLDDQRYLVPSVPHASAGIAWLRSHVARFAEGEEHRRRRALAASLLDNISPDHLRRPGHPIANLAEALGMPREVARDVETIAGSYQPHSDVSADADAAVGRLVAAVGGPWDETAAARIGLLVQTCAATRSMIASEDPPVAVTRRVAPTGEEVLVDLTSRPFGSGRHACPGAHHAAALAEGALAFHRLHDGPSRCCCRAPGTWRRQSCWSTPDSRRSPRRALASPSHTDSPMARETLTLARRLAQLPVPVSIDIEAGFAADPAELAAELTTLGAAGINIEDGRGHGLASAEVQASLVAAFKRSAPELFVNARVDTHWLRIDTHDTRQRVQAYVDAGADGIFVPGLVDEHEIERLITDLGSVPLNLLSQLPLSRLRDLGVRRVSTGSLLVRAALTHATHVACTYRDGGEVGDAITYDVLTSLMDRLPRAKVAPTFVAADCSRSPATGGPSSPATPTPPPTRYLGGPTPSMNR